MLSLAFTLPINSSRHEPFTDNVCGQWLIILLLLAEVSTKFMQTQMSKVGSEIALPAAKACYW